MNSQVDEIISRDGSRRVRFYQKENHTFTYQEEKFADADEEMAWIPVATQSVKIYDSLRTAKREAHTNIAWLRSLAHDNELRELLRLFIDRKDTSLKLANRIEGILILRYADTDLFEKLSVPLASYRPGGGEHLYDEDALIKEFNEALERSDKF